MDKVLACFTCSGVDIPKPTATGLVVAFIYKTKQKKVNEEHGYQDSPSSMVYCCINLSWPVFSSWNNKEWGGVEIEGETNLNWICVPCNLLS